MAEEGKLDTDCSTADTPAQIVMAMVMKVIEDNHRVDMHSPHGFAWRRCVRMPVLVNEIFGAPNVLLALMSVAALA